jgi:arsenite transporter
MTHAPEMTPAPHTTIAGRLSTLDRWLPLWIFLAMAIGIALGKAFPSLAVALDAMKLDTVSLPIAIGLLWMMYPVLARVNYGKIPAVAGNTKLLTTSLVLNWVIGPALMFVLA